MKSLRRGCFYVISITKIANIAKDNCDGTICYEGEVFQKNIFDGVGKIGNIMVSCINAKNQVLFHLGYEFGESDIHDVKLLCKEFNIPIPKEYENF